MGYIKEFCEDKINFLRWQLRLALRKIDSGPVIFGEAHDKPYARAIICDLIEAGKVERLFLEFSDIPLSDIFENQKGTIQEHLNWHIEANKAIDDCGLCIAFFEGLGYYPAGGRYKNPIPLSTLIQLAVENGVGVYFWDTAMLRNRISPSSPQGMRQRNISGGEIFKMHAGGLRGTVVLAGGEHLLPIPSGGKYKLTLQARCGIGFNHVVDFSRMR